MKDKAINRPLGVPITPDQAKKEKTDLIPDYVIEAVNVLIIKNLRPSSFTIKQKDLVAEIIKLKPSITSQELFDNHFLDIEPIFSKYGWDIRYDKPGYSESYDAYFEFKAKK